MDECQSGSIYYRPLNEHDAVAVYPMTFGKARLTLADRHGYSLWNGYCYANVAQALAAAEVWAGKEDPLDGWHRHVDTGRRRENGDPTKERQWW